MTLTKEQFYSKNWKVLVNPEVSRYIQQGLFALGFTWNVVLHAPEPPEPAFVDSSFLIIDTGLKIIQTMIHANLVDYKLLDNYQSIDPFELIIFLDNQKRENTIDDILKKYYS
jgi:hypothetical protein